MNLVSSVPALNRRSTLVKNFQWELAQFLEGQTEACSPSPSWNDAVHFIGHLLVRIGLHGESKPGLPSRRRAVSARV